MNGATNCASQSTEGRSDPPVKPTSEVAHQPGQQQTWPTVAEDMKTWVTHPQLVTARSAARPCGGVQRGETKSAGQTTGGARGGSRLGNPCDEDGLTSEP